MHIVYASETFDQNTEPTLFLAGPTPRNKTVVSCRNQALEILEKLEYHGAVFVPEPRTGPFPDYITQISWEEEHLKKADLILFWIPRDMNTLPGLTTNIEWGRWESSGKVVLGYPSESDHMRYIAHYAEKYKVPTFSTLEDTLGKAVALLKTK